jgi:hypothetical protein
MTQQEFTNIAVYLKTAYPSSNFLPTKETIKLWYEELKDLDGQVCARAMKEYVRNNDFPPSIAGIRRSCTSQAKAFAKPWNEAWDGVMAAVKKYGTYGAAEAMESLDDLTRKAVRAIGFYEICTNPNTSYLRHEFKNIYEGYKNEHDYKTQAGDYILAIEDKSEDD